MDNFAWTLAEALSQDGFLPRRAEGSDKFLRLCERALAQLELLHSADHPPQNPNRLFPGHTLNKGGCCGNGRTQENADARRALMSLAALLDLPQGWIHFDLGSKIHELVLLWNPITLRVSWQQRGKPS